VFLTVGRNKCFRPKYLTHSQPEEREKLTTGRKLQKHLLQKVRTVKLQLKKHGKIIIFFAEIIAYKI
jgi:hypothetical protein